MSVRAILSILVLALAFSCKNEPYQNPPLAITNLVDHGANITNTFVYREQRLYSFFSMGTDTIAYMRFHYDGDELKRISSDSTKYSLKESLFYAAGDVVSDSTFLNDSTGHHLLSVRTISYDGDRNPVTVDVRTWPDSVLNEQLAELTWEDGNVTRLATYDLSTGEKTLVRDLSVGYDYQNCIYMKNNNYLFTFALEELYWLSKNNPLTFSWGEGAKEYRYSYNKLGYPSSFEDEKKVLHGVAYKQMR